MENKLSRPLKCNKTTPAGALGGHDKPPTTKIEGGTRGGSGTDCGAVQPSPVPTQANDGSRPSVSAASTFRRATSGPPSSGILLSGLLHQRFGLVLPPSNSQPCRQWWVVSTTSMSFLNNRGETTVPISTASLPSRDIKMALLYPPSLPPFKLVFSAKRNSRSPLPLHTLRPRADCLLQKTCSATAPSPESRGFLLPSSANAKDAR